MKNIVSISDAAAVLRHVADLVEDGGLPAPTSVTGLYVHGVPTVQVSAADLPTWLTALEVCEPEWVRDNSDYFHAVWPAEEFEGVPFALASCTPAARAVSA